MADKKWVVALSVPVIVRVEVDAKDRDQAEEFALATYTNRDVAAHASDGCLGDDSDTHVVYVKQQ
jgi:hypothetical protein